MHYLQAAQSADKRDVHQKAGFANYLMGGLLSQASTYVFAHLGLNIDN